MVIGISRIELFIPHSRSLKDKRQVLKSLAQKIAHRFNVSVAEIDHHELWQRGAIGLAHVAISQTDSEKLLNHINAFAQSNTPAEVLRCEHWFYKP